MVTEERAVAADRHLDTSLLFTGAGSVGPSSRLRRARHRLRTHLSEHPALYLPLARRKYPGPSPQVVGPGTRVVIDGYTRSASTFAVYAFQIAQPVPVPMAHHLHAAAQLKEAVRRGLPTVMVIREPKGAVLSQLVREPDVDLLEALYAYWRFHETLLPYRHGLVVAEFREVTTHFDAVVRRLNARFGTHFAEFSGDPDQVEECHRLIEQRPTHSPVLLGFESGEVTLDQAREHVARDLAGSSGEATWIPSQSREKAKAALEDRWADPRLARPRNRAQDVYRQFVTSS